MNEQLRSFYSPPTPLDRVGVEQNKGLSGAGLIGDPEVIALAPSTQTLLRSVAGLKVCVCFKFDHVRMLIAP
jgi:hypothetical protein